MVNLPGCCDRAIDVADFLEGLLLDDTQRSTGGRTACLVEANAYCEVVPFVRIRFQRQGIRGVSSPA